MNPQEKNVMVKQIILNVAIMAIGLSSLSLAQQKTPPPAPGPQFVQGDATETCSVTYSSGTGETATNFCITVNGNISHFSIQGVELTYLPDYALGEGYGICDYTPNVEYYDYGYGESGNWLSPTFIHNGNLVTVTRKTSDGIWQLKQTFTSVPANATGPASVKVAMALKNLSSTPRAVYLVRYATVNYVDAHQQFFQLDFDYTAEFAYGLIPNFGRGLSTTNNTFAFDHLAFAQTTASGPYPCTVASSIAPQPDHSDDSLIQFWSLTIPGHGSKTVVSTYKPI
jgi:hypothetical protein